MILYSVVFDVVPFSSMRLPFCIPFSIAEKREESTEFPVLSCQYYIVSTSYLSLFGIPWILMSFYHLLIFTCYVLCSPHSASSMLSLLPACPYLLVSFSSNLIYLSLQYSLFLFPSFIFLFIFSAYT